MAKYKKYKKDFDYSYTLGIYLTIELLTYKPKQVIEVIVSTNTEDSDGVSKIKTLCDQHHIPFSVQDKMIQILSPKNNCYAIGFFHKYNEDLLPKENHLLLVNPSDAGNLGTMIRAGLGFDITNIGIISPGVDIFDPKAIRASMGSLFHIHFHYYDSFEEYQLTYDQHKLYPFMLQAKKKLSEIESTEKPFTLIFGNEATGLDQSFLNIGTSVIIPHSNKIDSLNLSVAASIAMYEMTKKNF